MADARWYPLFVTADLPVQTINSVLDRAANEKFQGTDEVVGNIWVLVQGRHQQTLTKPTNAPIPSYQSDFVGDSIEQVSAFVKSTFGETGRGRGSDQHYDWVSDTCFGVLDAQTAAKDTLLFAVDAELNMLEEAEVRISHGQGSKEDESLTRFAAGKASQEDHDVLIKMLDKDQSLSSPASGDDAPARLRLWFDEQVDSYRSQWKTFTLKVDIALQCTHGIYQRGVLDMLTSPEDFDEDGVML